MSWKDALNYLKKAQESHGTVPEVARADVGLPLGARIGGIVKMQLSPVIRASANGSLIKAPVNADMLIEAVSRVRLNLDGKIHRYYLNRGDEGSLESFVQVYSKENGEIGELLYCTHLTRIIPETADDQDAFTGVNGSGLGQQFYSLWREQIAELGLDAATLNTVFGEGQEIRFTRDMGGDAEFLTPLVGTETRIDDANGEHGLKQKIYFMPYVRALGESGGHEYLIITTEIVESQDGDSSKRSIHVDLMIGIPVEPERISVQ